MLKRVAFCIYLCLVFGCDLPNARPGGGGSIFRPGGNTEDWEIVCGRFEGPDRISVADELGAALKGVQGLVGKLVRVVHEERRSIITYGRFPLPYTELGGVEMSPEIRRGLTMIRSLALGDQFPFLTAVPQPIPMPDPPAPAEWDLRNASGVYTLQVGVFYNTPKFHERKQAAVEWVKDMRSRGFPGFFDHGRTISTVTVGSFDESAVLEEPEAPIERDGTKRRPLRDYSQDVYAFQKLPEFQHNLVNGAIEKIERMPQRSFLVKIPHGEEAGEGGLSDTGP